MLTRSSAAMGRFAVRFRWLVVLAWIAGAVAAVTQLPALSSVTQGNNAKFPGRRAQRACGGARRAVRHGEPGDHSRRVGPAGIRADHGDLAALTALQGKLRSVSGVVKVVDAGQSRAGQAEPPVAVTAACRGPPLRL